MILQNYNSLSVIVVTIMLVLSKVYLNGEAFWDGKLFFVDSTSQPLIFLTLLLLILTMVTSNFYTKDEYKNVSLCIITIIGVYFFFGSSNLLVFFVLYEGVLIPLMILIYGFGSQAERITASHYVIMYTLVSSSLFLLVVVIVVWVWGSISLINFSIPFGESINTSIPFITSEGVTFILHLLLLSLFANIPMFFFHSWLLNAHVEAPLEGSIILAGVMLNVGVYGVYRVIMIMNSLLHEESNILFCTLALVGSLYGIFSALACDDLKVCVALCSVAHINLMLSGLFSLNESSIAIIQYTMVSHGLSSSLLFFYVTILYLSFHSRSIFVSKGGGNTLVNGTITIFFLLLCTSMSTPPFLSFLSEVITVALINSFSFLIGVVIIIPYIMCNSFFGGFFFLNFSHSKCVRLLIPNTNKEIEFQYYFLLFGYTFLCLMLVFMLSPDFM